MNSYNVGIILDGNRRWAKERGLPSFKGHKKGLDNAKKIIIHAKKRGVGMMVLFIFSTENWKREKKEVDFLMDLIESFFKKEFKNKKKKNFLFKEIKVKIIGQREGIPKKIKKIISEIEDYTKENEKMVLNLAFSYGGRSEIVEAAKKIIKEKIPLENINEDYFQKKLFVSSDLDIVIRPGKEKRISNFLIWQSAYSELFFLNKYWPDFTEDDFDNVVKEYKERQRRFGK